jgi:hypothetical protein
LFILSHALLSRLGVVSDGNADNLPREMRNAAAICLLVGSRAAAQLRYIRRPWAVIVPKIKRSNGWISLVRPGGMDNK